MMPKSIIHWKFETSGSVCYRHNEHKLVLTSIQNCILNPTWLQCFFPLVQEPIKQGAEIIYLHHIKEKVAILVDIGMEAECVKFEGIVCRVSVNFNVNLWVSPS